MTRADSLLDYVVAGKFGSYDEIRQDLASAYKEAGLVDVSNFIITAS